MTWFGNAKEVAAWGGPRFRYPFTRETFRQDCHWPAMASFSLWNPDREFSAFGQLYERKRRIQLARLVVHPHRRGRGIGRRLVTMLISIGPELLPLTSFSLFVYRDNEPALNCYLSLGFEIQDCPDDHELAGECHYMTRPV